MASLSFDNRKRDKLKEESNGSKQDTQVKIQGPLKKG